MIELISALSMVLFIMACGKWLHFDRDRSYYPTILMVIALAYLLLAVLDGRSDVILAEFLFASLFIVGAILGSLYSNQLVAILLIAHGLFDLIHPYLVANEAVPGWYALFCLVVDLLLGLWVLYLDSRGVLPTPLRIS